MAFKLTPADKKVISAFLDKKAGSSKKLSTDGKSLDIMGLGGKGCCVWEGGKIRQNDLGSRTSQTVQRAVRKMAPKGYIEGVLGSETRKALEQMIAPTEGYEGPSYASKPFLIQAKPKGSKGFIGVSAVGGGTAGDRTLKGAIMMVKNTYKKMDPETEWQIIDTKTKKVVWREGKMVKEEVEMTVFTEEQREELSQLAEAVSDEARELRLYVDNDYQLYKSQTLPIIKNLMTKRARGQYDSGKAAKLVMYLMDAAAKKYTKEHSSRDSKWNEVFPKADRLAAAKDWVTDFEAEAATGNYDEYLPKKYQKKESR